MRIKRNTGHNNKELINLGFSATVVRVEMHFRIMI